MTTLADKLGALHVWPQHVADNYADTLTPKEIEKLYEVGNVAEEALRALRERDQAVEALREAERAIAEYYRYWTGGETRGSYDGKPERNGLWKAKHKARQTLASIEGAGHE